MKAPDTNLRVKRKIKSESMAIHAENGEKLSPIIVVMVSFPAQSHMNQLLHLSSLIASYNIQLHFVGSAVHNQQLMVRARGLNPEDINKINFHHVSLPAFESLPPKPNSRFPDHMIPFMHATVHLREPVAEVLLKLAPTTRRMVIVHDALIASAVQDAATLPNAEFYAFNAVSAFTAFSFFWEVIGKPSIPQVEMPKELPSREGTEPAEFTNFVMYQYKFMKKLSGVLHNTCRSLEGAYLDVWTKLEGGKKKRWAIGPLNVTNVNHRNSNSQHKCLDWLEKQPPKSVLYISFGTSVSLREDQVNEIAKGLEESRIRFIWVLRYADRGDIFTGEEKRYTLPEGFEKRIEGRGIITRDWAPQTDILRHTSTGGFMSHCDWNSCIESINMGVPMAAWPMHTDQPRNATFLMKMQKAGLVVREWDERDQIVAASQIKDVVCRLMASEEGDQLRKRASELGDMLHSAVKEGGVSRMELDAFIAHIKR